MAADAALEVAGSAAPPVTAAGSAIPIDPSVVPEGDWVADLSAFGLISVAGPEASQFLNSLFTGDVRTVSAGQGQFTSWCDGKGRILTSFWLFMRGEEYCLLLPRALLDSTLARLKQFLFRTKATIRDASADWLLLGLCGAGIAASMCEVKAAATRNLGSTFDVEGCTFIALGSVPQPRWIAIGPAESLTAFKTKHLPGVEVARRESWALADILAGIPVILPETSGEFIPQMVNLEALGGLSFKKGCYPGQEVVARLHYRGQLKRSLYRASVTAEVVPTPGTKLYGPGTSESVGMVLAAAAAAPGEAALLGVIVIEQQEQGDVRLGEPDGPQLHFAAEAGEPGAAGVEV